jgi:hypothetical protein
VAEAIFGPSIRQGVTFTEQEFSRKQIVPLINDVLKSQANTGMPPCLRKSEHST